jgi:helix-turn-helix protein
VDIGGALAEARTEAGLTVTQVSERTRIRETIIRGIERDDYSACGGDYYARGHIRAIARVVGTDPVPLIEEYDAAHMPPEPAEPDPGHGDGPGWHIPGLHRIAHGDPGGNGLNPTIQDGNGAARNSASRNRHGSAPLGSDAEPNAAADADTGTNIYNPATLKSGGPAAGRGSGALDSAARWAGSARFRFARPPEPQGGGVPGGITAAEAFRPSMPLEPRRSPRAGTRVLALIVLAAIGTLIYLLVSGGSSPAPRQHAAPHHSASAGLAKRPSRSAPATTAPSQAPGLLTAVSATAFGPGGVAHGDDPQQASLTIKRSDSVGWRTDWYASANFGGLQSGTGLLLDMGTPVTVTGAQIRLGAAAGGEIQLRAGNTPTLGRLHIVAQASNPGGILTLPVSAPVSARYLLVWFTALPPDNSGTYQASVYTVSLLGTS